MEFSWHVFATTCIYILAAIVVAVTGAILIEEFGPKFLRFRVWLSYKFLNISYWIAPDWYGVNQDIRIKRERLDMMQTELSNVASELDAVSSLKDVKIELTVKRRAKR